MRWMTGRTGFFALSLAYIALVVARPESLSELDVTVLDLPERLNGDVARPA